VSVASLLVGIGGGSGSGKTALAMGVAKALPAGQVVVIPADAYYRDLGHLPPEERAGQNFDEPAALDNERLCDHLGMLVTGQPIARPAYDFATHTRLADPVRVLSAPVVILEGILVLALPALREILDLKVFVAASERTRLSRRIARDVGERGRTRESVEAQFSRHTQPMHDRHVAPCEARADVVVSGEEEPARAVERVVTSILAAPRAGNRA